MDWKTLNHFILLIFFNFHVYTLGYVTLCMCGIVSVYSVAVGVCRCAYGLMCACVPRAQMLVSFLASSFPFFEKSLLI